MSEPVDPTSVEPSRIPQRKGPWLHRFFIHFCSLVLLILVYWLLGFVLADIGVIKGPDFGELERKYQDPAIKSQHDELRKQIRTRQQLTKEAQGKRDGLREEVANLDKTIGQLVEFQRLAIEKEVTFPESELQILQTNRSTFFEKQHQIQDLTVSMTRTDGEARELTAQADLLQTTLSQQRGQAQVEYRTLEERHKLFIAGLKLLVLLPLALVVSWLMIKKRKVIYLPMIYASGIAIYLKLGMVIHEYFPRRYFKYIALLVALVIVVKTLIYLLKVLVAPKRDWLMKQYREAYEKFLCPICSYPIRRGPRKHLFWTARTVKKLAVPAQRHEEKDQPYTCPSCTTTLYEQCQHCSSVRPSLLPACDHCGHQKEVVQSSG